MISTETYVKAFAGIFGVYGLQMGLVPGKVRMVKCSAKHIR